MLQIFVVRVWLEAQPVLERHGKRNDEVQRADLGEEIFLACDGVVVALLGVHPDEAREVLADEGQLGPVLAAFIVALVGRGGAEAERETDDETQDREEELVDAHWERISVVSAGRNLWRTDNHAPTC